MTELNAVFQRSDKIGIRQLEHLQTVFLLHVTNPFVGLALGVDEERPPSGVADDDAVVDAERVCG